MLLETVLQWNGSCWLLLWGCRAGLVLCWRRCWEGGGFVFVGQVANWAGWWCCVGVGLVWRDFTYFSRLPLALGGICGYDKEYQ